MSKKSLLGSLLEAAQKQQQAIEALRAIKDVDPEMESLFEQVLKSFNVTVTELLRRYLDKVTLKLIAKDRSWQDKYALIVISYGNAQIRILARAIEELDEEIYLKVKTKIMTAQIVDGQLRSIVNPDLPMAWAKWYGVDLSNQVGEIWGLPSTGPWKNHSVAMLMYAFEAESSGDIELSQLVFLEGQLESNLRLVIRYLAEKFRLGNWTTKFYDEVLDPLIDRIKDEEMEAVIAARRSQRVAWIVKIKKGETRLARYAYGFNAVSPDGERFSLVNSGSTRYWEFNSYLSTWCRWESGKVVKLETLELIPTTRPIEIATRSNRAVYRTPVDLERIDDEDGYWRWVVYLPNDQWKIEGGSTFFMGIDETQSRRATVEKGKTS